MIRIPIITFYFSFFSYHNILILQAYPPTSPNPSDSWENYALAIMLFRKSFLNGSSYYFRWHNTTLVFFTFWYHQMAKRIILNSPSNYDVIWYAQVNIEYLRRKFLNQSQWSGKWNFEGFYPNIEFFQFFLSM